MNKLLKGAVAGAAGVALLLGGAGTFALWNSSGTVDVGTVTSGTLSIVKSGNASWKNISADAPAGGSAIPSIASYRIIPGDKLELTQLVTVTAAGNNLKATLSVDDASITGALKSSLSPITLTASGTGISAGTALNTFAIAPSATATTVTITAIVELPSSVSGTTGQNSTVDLSEVAFTLQQNVR